jgi:hypothetical protein
LENVRNNEKCTLEEPSQYAIKLSTVLFDDDVSLSYFYEKDDLPLANNVIMTPVDTMGTIDLEIDLPDSGSLIPENF